MQIFLPYEDFEETARCLDYRRLGKQRVEARQIIELLDKYDKGIDISKLPWSNHPIVNMWKGYTFCLKVYYNAIVKEWKRRGYINNMPLYRIRRGITYRVPDWLGDKQFHDNYKRILLNKNYEYYKQFNWKV